MGVNSLPRTVTRQRRDCDLNPGPSAPESTRLPNHPLPYIDYFYFFYHEIHRVTMPPPHLLPHPRTAVHISSHSRLNGSTHNVAESSDCGTDVRPTDDECVRDERGYDLDARTQRAILILPRRKPSIDESNAGHLSPFPHLPPAKNSHREHLLPVTDPKGLFIACHTDWGLQSKQVAHVHDSCFTARSFPLQLPNITVSGRL